MTQVSIPTPTEATLRMVSNLVCEIAGEVEAMFHDLEAAHTKRWTEYVEALKGETEVVEVEELEPAAAWSFQVFAKDMRLTAEDLSK